MNYVKADKNSVYVIDENKKVIGMKWFNFTSSYLIPVMYDEKTASFISVAGKFSASYIAKLTRKNIVLWH